MSKQPTFTGRSRKRKTSKRIFITDLVARAMITVGGIGTIIAISTVFLFLLAVVWPLLMPPEVEETGSYEVAWEARRPLLLQSDEHRILGWAVLPDGMLVSFRLDDGEELARARIFEDREITAASFVIGGTSGVFGFADGGFEYCRFRVRTSFLTEEQIGPELAALKEGETHRASWTIHTQTSGGEPIEIPASGLVQLVKGQYRGQSLHVEKLGGKRIGAGRVRLVDLSIDSSETPMVCAMLEGESGPELHYVGSSIKRSMSTGEESLRFKRTRELPFETLAATPPSFLKLSGNGRNIFVAWSDGSCLRIVNDPPQEPFVAERLDLVPDAQDELTRLDFLIGRETLLAGTARGALTAWFTVPYDGSLEGWVPIDTRRVRDSGETVDARWIFEKGSTRLGEFKRRGELDSFAVREEAIRGVMDLCAPNEEQLERYLAAMPGDDRKLVHAKTLEEKGPAVTTIASSSRGRMICTGFSDGSVGLYQVTTEARLARVETGAPGPVIATLIFPKENGLLALTRSGIHRWWMDPGHAEVTLGTLFRPVWYEGREAPVHEWQSSASTDDTEAKLGLMPMVYGTLKATFYSILFGAPLALLAAIYTSEFLKPRWKASIKPTIELMASLPSVVLGFLAGLVFAPVADRYLSGILGAFVALPLAYLVGAYLWQLLPYRHAMRFSGLRFPLMVVLVFPLGLASGLVLLGPAVEQLLFMGDLKQWLHGAEVIPQQGARVGGWMLILLPISALLVAVVGGRLGRGLLASRAGSWSRRRTASFDALRFLAGILLTVAVAWGLALIGSSVDDPRGEGSILGTFDRKNALVVGFIMGFAIIPIIYTIAEDALSTVPDHLRSASLGAGATPWQTAVRIVIPTAMSGLFSACMIGIGRAVGETMIVVMATGGTPIMEPNMFNGFRTLSQNIATELPEAPPGSSHYRTLFLAGLLLFAMTFVLNTIAEMVRLRFRKRAFEL